MQEFKFEYTNLRIYRIIFGLCFALFLSLLFTLIYLAKFIKVKNELAPLVIVGIAAIIPYIIFRLNKKKFKLFGTALIYENHVELQLTGSTININYGDIKSYLIQIYDGVLIRFIMKDGKKVSLAANESYSDSEQFELFSENLQLSIEEYNVKNNVSSGREKSFFEKKWIYYFLIIMTGIILILFVWAIFYLQTFKASMLVPLGALLTLWAGYLNTRRKEKDR